MFAYRSALTSAFMLFIGLVTAHPAHAQLTILESGFASTLLSNDLAKQVEIGVGADTCIYYGTFDGLSRRCGAFDPGTICDPALTFPAGIAFSTEGPFGNYTYVADYGLNDIYRMSGCGMGTLFATIPSPGSIAFPPAGSAYGDYLYACEAFSGPIYRVSSTGDTTTWKTLETTYLRFGPGGPWGTSLYATHNTTPGTAGIVQVSSTGDVTPFVGSMLVPEGFDWGFDGDMFATDPILGEIYRIKSNGTRTTFATLPGAADVAYRPGEMALYVVSNQGGFYRIVAGSTSGVESPPPGQLRLSVSPNPARGACVFQFSMPAAGIQQARVVDTAGRVVRHLGSSWRPAGAHSLAWDGRDDAGVAVRPGQFFARVTTAGRTQTVRVAIYR